MPVPADGSATMSFYERQAAARRASGWLLLAFVLAVALVVAALSIVVFVPLAGDHQLTIGEFLVEEPALATSVALGWLALIMGASVVRSLQLRAGGGVVARALGGTRVDRTTSDPDLLRLRNVVEEMAIASGA